jgi:hypothetical protein
MVNSTFGENPDPVKVTNWPGWRISALFGFEEADECPPGARARLRCGTLAVAPVDGTVVGALDLVEDFCPGRVTTDGAALVPDPTGRGAPTVSTTVVARRLPFGPLPPNTTSWLLTASNAPAAPIRLGVEPPVGSWDQAEPFHNQVSPSAPEPAVPPASTTPPAPES